MDRFRVAKHVAWQKVGDDVVVVDLRSGQTVAFNATASWIWQAIAGGSEDLEASIRAQFDVPTDVTHDIAEFTSMLQTRGLIEPHAEPPSRGK